MATALAARAGSLCGLLAGFVGRWVDQLIMRSIDTLMAFPYFPRGGRGGRAAPSDGAAPQERS